MMLKALLWFSSVVTLGFSDCDVLINGIENACNLDFNHFTFAGSHNSGSGPWGTMRHLTGENVPDCSYRNQEISFRSMLRNYGIRYFDLDVNYVDANKADGKYWIEGITLQHGDAYSRPLVWALGEINEFLGQKGCVYEMTNFDGSDIKTVINIKSMRACVAQCRNETGCLSVTHEPSTEKCWLKSRRFGREVNRKLGVNSRTLDCKEPDKCLERDWVYKGANISPRLDGVRSIEECVKRCRETEDCVAVSHQKSQGYCWRKSKRYGDEVTRKEGINSRNVDCNGNQNEIVSMRIKDHNKDKAAMIRDALENEFNRTISQTALNPNRNFNLMDALKNNQRLLVFVDTRLGKHPKMLPLIQFETWEKTNIADHGNKCFSAWDQIARLIKSPNTGNLTYHLEINWFFPYFDGGLCLREMAQVCSGDEYDKLTTVNDEIIRRYNRPGNAYTIDYVGVGDSDRKFMRVIEAMNKKNVQKFG